RAGARMSLGPARAGARVRTAVQARADSDPDRIARAQVDPGREPRIAPDPPTRARAMRPPSGRARSSGMRPARILRTAAGRDAAPEFRAPDLDHGIVEQARNRALSQEAHRGVGLSVIPDETDRL